MKPAESVLLAALAAGTLDPDRPRERLLAHLAGHQPFAGFVDRVAALFALDATTCRALLAGVERPDGWRPLSPTTQARRVSPRAPLAAPAASLFALFEAGSHFAHHTHDGDETTLVLRGGFTDDLTGRHLRPGDTLTLPAGTAHSLLIDPGEPCLAAVRLLGPLPF